MTDLEVGQLLTDEEYYEALETWGDEFEAGMELNRYKLY